MELVENIIFTVREPTQTLISILKRRANDQVEFGSNVLSNPEVLERISSIPEERWRDKSWERMDVLLGIAIEQYKEKIAIISGLSLRFNPHATLKKLSDQFGWHPFNSDMVNNWQVSSGPNFFAPPPKYASSQYQTGVDENGIVLTEYYRAAATSTGFSPLDRDKDGPVNIDTFTPPMQEHLLNELLPIYFHFLQSDLNISKPTIVELLGLVDQSVLKLDEINPIEALILLSGISGLAAQLEIAQADLLGKIREDLSKSNPVILERLDGLIENKN